MDEEEKVHYKVDESIIWPDRLYLLRRQFVYVDDQRAYGLPTKIWLPANWCELR